MVKKINTILQFFRAISEKIFIATSAFISVLMVDSTKKITSFAIVILFLLNSTIAFARSSLTTSGDILQVALPISGLALATIKQDREGQKEFLKSFLVNTAITQALKYSLKNTDISRRPNGGKYSFPSGHTSSAFQGAFFLNNRYGYQYGMPALGLAGFTGYTRVKGKYHHWRDVAGGAIIAFGVNYFMVTKYEKEKLELSTNFSKDSSVISLKMDL